MGNLIALGRHIIVKPISGNTVMKATEVETIFEIISIGQDSDLGSLLNDLTCGDRVIVTPNSVEKTFYGYEEIFYVRGTDIVAKIDRDSEQEKTL